MFYTDWRLAIVGLLVLPLMIIPTRNVSKKRWMLVAEAHEKYDELNQKANRIANELIKKGVKPKSNVLVMIHKFQHNNYNLLLQIYNV